MEKESDLSVSLNRFLIGQKDMYEVALREITAGKKTSHWMWFIFPQLRGLGKSRFSYIFGVEDADEAKAYLAHPVLNERLVVCCNVMLRHDDKSAKDILGDIDAMKLRSSMTLFAAVSQEPSVFHDVLQRFYGGKTDRRTEKILEKL